MILLIDIGGTYTKISRCIDLKKIDEFNIYPTKYSYKEFMKFIRNFKDRKIKLACIGIAGFLNRNKNKIIYSPSLKDYVNKNLKKDLEKELKTKVILENDAYLGALGEAYFGRGKNFYSFGYITLGTGIGGAKIINKKVDNNDIGFEPGHSIILIENFKKFMEVENLIGAKNIELKYGVPLFRLKNKNFWNFYYQVLAAFLINASIFWSVEKIIMSGSISKIIDYKKLIEICKNKHPLPLNLKIYPSKLKEKSVIYGALIKCQNYT